MGVFFYFYSSIFLIQNQTTMSFNIDIHCHSSSKPFMSGIDHQGRTPYESYDFAIEHPIYNLLKKPLAQFSKVRLATQSNFDRMYEGGLRVAFISITPIEKAFTVLNPIANTFKGQLMQAFLKEKSNYREGFLSSKAINALTGYKVSDLDDVKGKYYDVYNDLFIKELAYVYSFDGVKSTTGNYTIKFPKNYEELSLNLEDDAILNILITVEGAHSFGRFDTLQTIQDGINHSHNADSNNFAIANTMCTNLMHLRTQFPVPIFSISLCHHFWNGLGGHARSLNNLISEVVNQEEGLNSGLQQNGKIVLNELGKTQYENKSVPQILMDIKHMSPACRKDFYNYRKTNPLLNKRPIICTHTGINMSFETLQKWIDYVKVNTLEKEGKAYQDGTYYLHEKSINLCREDLLEIYHSNGIIGIQLDEKRIMGPLAFAELDKKNEEGDQDQIKYVYAKVLWANIFCAIDELKLAKVADIKKAWDMICIGSDFDGLINHLRCFETASKMDSLKYTMGYFLEEPQSIPLFRQDTNHYTMTIDQLQELKCGYSNKQLIDKIFCDNALNFLKNNFKIIQ